MRIQELITEKWTKKYKSSINCSHPKGFSQKAHCAGKKKHNESYDVTEATCPDCGTCQSHGSLNQILAESTVKNKLTLLPLPYAKTDLAPAISQDTINYHYGKLAQGYVERYNAGEGNADFNQAGAFLHNILFPQYKKVSSANKPKGAVLEFIEKHFKTFDNFQKEFEKTAMAIQGSGWVYLAQNGIIKTIANHAIKKDIVLLIDWWEHAMYDYKWDKKGYLTNQWKIINWDIVSAKINA